MFCTIAMSPLAAMATPEVFNPDGDFVDINPVLGQPDTYTIALGVFNTLGFANFVISTDNPNDVLQSVEILLNSDSAVNPDQWVALSIRNPQNPFLPTEFASIGDIIADSRVDTRVTAINNTGDLGRNVSGDNGVILVDRLGSIDILGNWYADVVVNDQVSPVTDSAPTAFVGGDVLGGSLLVATGEISIMSVAGEIKNTLSTFELWGNQRLSRVGAGSIDDININAPNGFSDPEINLFSIDGDFHSSVPMVLEKFAGLSNSLSNNAGGLVINGDFGAQITVNTPLGESNPQQGTKSKYFIAGSFLAGAAIELPADGLTPQIFINKDLNGGTWESGGDVVVGGTTLAVPYYTQLSSELGGGAVGEAPFNFHQRVTTNPSGVARDCNPYHTEQFTVSPFVALDEVVISHYGPVYVDGTGNHFYIEFKSDIFSSLGSPQWVDVSSQFEVTSSNVSDGTAQRDIVIEPKSMNQTGFEASGHWRITPVDGKVKCGSVAGNPKVVYDSSVTAVAPDSVEYDWYVFRVRQQPFLGMTVLDNGTGPSFTDLSTWLTNPYEVNADGETNSQDFIDMTNEYTGN